MLILYEKYLKGVTFLYYRRDFFLCLDNRGRRFWFLLYLWRGLSNIRHLFELLLAPSFFTQPLLFFFLFSFGEFLIVRLKTALNRCKNKLTLLGSGRGLCERLSVEYLSSLCLSRLLSRRRGGDRLLRLSRERSLSRLLSPDLDLLLLRSLDLLLRLLSRERERDRLPIMAD